MWFEGAIASGKFGGKKKACRIVEGVWREKNVPPQVGVLIISKLQSFVEGGGNLIVF